MSFVGLKSRIEAGDTVIIYINPHRMHAIEVKSKRLNKNSEEIDNVFQTQFGALNVESLIGREFGSKILLPKGWIYVLHPTCEMWTQTLPHRTQIIYTPDISLILFQLDLKPGSVVLEAGKIVFLSRALCLNLTLIIFILQVLAVVHLLMR